jgi:hypothetical protein
MTITAEWTFPGLTTTREPITAISNAFANRAAEEARAKQMQTEHMMRTRHRTGTGPCALDLDPATRSARLAFRESESARWAAMHAACRL